MDDDTGQAAENGKTIMPSVEPNLNRSKILIVEDDKAIYNACQMLLQHYEYQVSLAKTLAEGRQLLLSSPDLMILDLSLPDGDGIQLLEKVRTTGLKTRVFVLTGDSSKETERKIRRWMPDRFFRKPLNFMEILDAIRLQFPAATPEGEHVGSFLDVENRAV